MLLLLLCGHARCLQRVRPCVLPEARPYLCGVGGAAAVVYVRASKLLLHACVRLVPTPPGPLLLLLLLPLVLPVPPLLLLLRADGLIWRASSLTRALGRLQADEGQCCCCRCC